MENFDIYEKIQYLRLILSEFQRIRFNPKSSFQWKALFQ
jgi:hypothetical protein